MASLGKQMGGLHKESEKSLLDVEDVTDASSEDEASQTDHVGRKSGSRVSEINAMGSSLSLARIIRSLNILSGNPANVPTFFFNSETSKLLAENVNYFCQAIVAYAVEVPPQYWYLLFPSTDRVRGMNVLVDEAHFPADFKFAGKTQTYGTNEVPLDQLNWYRIMLDCRQRGFQSVLRSGKTRSLKDDVRSIEKYMDKAMSKSGGEFGRIICSLLVKLFDGKCITEKPSKRLRQSVFGDDSPILRAYAKMKALKDGSETELMWDRKLALEDELLQYFPKCTPLGTSKAVIEEECVTDEEGNDDVFDAKGLCTIATPANSTFNSKTKLIPITTSQGIKQIEEEIAAEERRENNYLELATLARSKIEGLQEKLKELKIQQVKQEADDKLLEGVYSTMTHDEYIKNAYYVPEVFRDVLQVFRQSGAQNFSEYWKKCVDRLKSRVIEDGSEPADEYPGTLDWVANSGVRPTDSVKLARRQRTSVASAASTSAKIRPQPVEVPGSEVKTARHATDPVFSSTTNKRPKLGTEDQIAAKEVAIKEKQIIPGTEYMVIDSSSDSDCEEEEVARPSQLVSQRGVAQQATHSRQTKPGIEKKANETRIEVNIDEFEKMNSEKLRLAIDSIRHDSVLGAATIVENDHCESQSEVEPYIEDSEQDNLEVSRAVLSIRNDSKATDSVYDDMFDNSGTDPMS